MNEKISLTLIQPDIVWEKVSENLENYSLILGRINEDTDLIILPEMFTTGFSMNSKFLAEPPGDVTMKWMEKWSRKLDCVVTGSIIISVGDNYFNRLIWMRPDGSFSFYDKRHLFGMENEHLHYTKGNSRFISQIREWKICPLICYDLRFPVWSRNRYYNSQWDYDLLIYVANWPAKRDKIWTTLLAARAIENQAYVAGVNRVGVDGNGISYAGNSLVVDLTGNIATMCTTGMPDYKTIVLSRDELAKNREFLGAGSDWDKFDITV
jgi:omega-amidase